MTTAGAGLEEYLADEGGELRAEERGSPSRLSVVCDISEGVEELKQGMESMRATVRDSQACIAQMRGEFIKQTAHGALAQDQ